MKRSQTRRTALPTLPFGQQLAQLSLLENPEQIAQLDDLRAPGYRLSSQAVALAEKILREEPSREQRYTLVCLSSSPVLGLAAVHLCTALATLSQSETLVVQANQGDSSLDEAFGPWQGGTLCSLLSGKSTEAHDTKVPFLRFLPFGERAEAPLITTRHLHTCLTTLKAEKSRVAFISPSSQSSATASLLLSADAVIGFAAKGETSQLEVQALRDSCTALRVPLLGSVFVS